MDTSIPIPAVLEDAITQGAKRLGKALEKLEWPNAGSDAPCHEINAIFNVAYFLNSASFLTYLEAATVNRGRVDLIGFNDDIAFALEAKGWGRLNS